MTSETHQEMIDWSGRTIYDSADQKVGRVEQLWLDDRNGEPEWLTVNTGLLGMKHSFVPVQGIRGAHENDLQTPFTREQIKNAPTIEPNSDHLGVAEEKQLYAHYGLTDQHAQRGSGQKGTDTVGQRATGEGRQARDRDEKARGQDEAMTLSEERLRVGTERHEIGHARLHKYVVTEDVQVNVPVSHERARIVHEPITEENRKQAMSGSDISEADYEVTLHEEVPVVRTETVPVDRVRLAKENVTDNQTVSRKIRKERIKAEGNIEEEPPKQQRR